MIRQCVVTVSFQFDDGDADSLDDAQWYALNYVQQHIMDDENFENPSIHIVEMEIE